MVNFKARRILYKSVELGYFVYNKASILGEDTNNNGEQI